MLNWIKFPSLFVRGIHKLSLVKWLLMMFVSSSSLLAQGPGWKKVDVIPKSPYANEYRDIKCADSLNCIIWGLTGSDNDYYFRRTTNGGISWENVYYSEILAPQICAIAYPSVNLFIATSCNGSILRSSDKGETWEKTKMDSMQRIGRLNMYNDKIGLGIGGGIEPFKYLYFRTIDGGVSWKIMNTPQRFFKETIDSPQMIGSNVFAGIRHNGSYIETIWVEGDWEYWFVDSSANNSKYNPVAIYFLNRKRGWAAGGGKVFGSNNYPQLIMHTEDGGKSWITQRDTNFWGEPLQDIKFFDNNFGIAAGGMYSVIITTNGGTTWNMNILATDDILGGIHSIQITSSTTAYVIRDGDGIYKYFESLDVAELELMNNEFSIYPNPVSDILRISGVPSYFPVRIFTPEGIKVLEMKPPLSPFEKGGSMEIDVRSLAAGLYFLQVGNKVEKFVKL